MNSAVFSQAKTLILVSAAGILEDAESDWKSLRSETIRTFSSQNPHGETDNWRNASVTMDADISRNVEDRPHEVKGGACKPGC